MNKDFFKDFHQEALCEREQLVKQGNEYSGAFAVGDFYARLKLYLEDYTQKALESVPPGQIIELPVPEPFPGTRAVLEAAEAFLLLENMTLKTTKHELMLELLDTMIGFAVDNAS